MRLSSSSRMGRALFRVIDWEAVPTKGLAELLQGGRGHQVGARQADDGEHGGGIHSCVCKREDNLSPHSLDRRMCPHEATTTIRARIHRRQP